MHHQRGTADGEKNWPLDESRHTESAKGENRSRSRMTAPAQAVPDSGRCALHTSDNAVDRRAANSACRSRRRICSANDDTCRAADDVHPGPPTSQFGNHPYGYR